MKFRLDLNVLNISYDNFLISCHWRNSLVLMIMILHQYQRFYFLKYFVFNELLKFSDFYTENAKLRLLRRI